MKGKIWDNLNHKTKEERFVYEEYVELCDKLDQRCYDIKDVFDMIVECIKWYNKLNDDKA